MKRFPLTLATSLTAAGTAALLSTAVIAATPASDRAMLAPSPVKNMPGVAIPAVRGIAAPAAQRINTALDDWRRNVVQEAQSCRAAGGTSPTSYRVKPAVALNAHGVLSLDVSGAVMCGGAHGQTITAARTFDLRTGAEVDVVAATGLSAPALGKLAANGYRGPAACKTALLEGIGASQVTVRGAYLTPAGVAVNYDFASGAAQSCAGSPGIAPLAAIRSAGRLSAPLDRL